MLTISKRVRFKIHIQSPHRDNVKEVLDDLFIYYKESYRKGVVLGKIKVDSIMFECEAPEEGFNDFVKHAEKFDFVVHLIYY